MDNNGGYLDFTGGMKGEEFILSRKGLIRGKPGMQRMRFYNIEKDSLDWAWEVSFDEGETWALAWLLRYKRSE